MIKDDDDNLGEFEDNDKENDKDLTKDGVNFYGCEFLKIVIECNEKENNSNIIKCFSNRNKNKLL